MWELINEVCSCLIRCNPVRILINAQNESPQFSSSPAYKWNLVGWDLTNVTLVEEDTGTGAQNSPWNFSQIFQEYLRKYFQNICKSISTKFWQKFSRIFSQIFQEYLHKYYKNIFWQKEDAGISVQKTCWEVSAESLYWWLLRNGQRMLKIWYFDMNL